MQLFTLETIYPIWRKSLRTCWWSCQFILISFFEIFFIQFSLWLERKEMVKNWWKLRTFRVHGNHEIFIARCASNERENVAELNIVMFILRYALRYMWNQPRSFTILCIKNYNYQLCRHLYIDFILSRENTA